MPSPVQSALAAASASLARVSGVAVVYQAGGISIAIPDAVPGETPTEIDDIGKGFRVRATVADWLIHVARLVHDGDSIEPMPGHRIIWTDGDRVRTFEVQMLGQDECYRWSGPLHDRYRIHTREIPSQ